MKIREFSQKIINVLDKFLNLLNKVKNEKGVI